MPGPLLRLRLLRRDGWLRGVLRSGPNGHSVGGVARRCASDRAHLPKDRAGSFKPAMRSAAFRRRSSYVVAFRFIAGSDAGVSTDRATCPKLIRMLPVC